MSYLRNEGDDRQLWRPVALGCRPRSRGDRIRPAWCWWRGWEGRGSQGISPPPSPTVPVFVNKSYGLPNWVKSAEPLVVAMSYSGNTEETLSAAETAAAHGLTPAVVTGGGTLGAWAGEYGMACGHGPGGTAAAGSAWLSAGGPAAPAQRRRGHVGGAPRPVSAADMADSISGEGGSGWALAADLAAGLEGRIVAVYGGGGITSPVAQRWKTQINENAKWPAWYSVASRTRSQRDRLVDLAGRPDPQPRRDRQPAGSGRGLQGSTHDSGTPPRSPAAMWPGSARCGRRENRHWNAW